MQFSRIFSKSYMVFVTLLLAPVVQAEEPTNEFGLRANVLLGDGVPANDVPGVGLIARRYLDDGWFIGGSLDTYAYDFERPWSLVGIRQDPNVDVIDADSTTTTVAGFVGREYGDANNGFRWFWSLGLGFGFDSVDDVSGPTDTGETFDLAFDTGSNVQLQGAIGTSWYFSSRWSASFTARLERHFMDIKVTDRISGAASSVDSQTLIGGYLSLNYRF